MNMNKDDKSWIDLNINKGLYEYMNSIIDEGSLVDSTKELKLIELTQNDWQKRLN